MCTNCQYSECVTHLLSLSGTTHPPDPRSPTESGSFWFVYDDDSTPGNSNYLEWRWIIYFTTPIIIIKECYHNYKGYGSCPSWLIAVVASNRGIDRHDEGIINTEVGEEVYLFVVELKKGETLG